ncbi:hypothetical protein [Alicyclobacillus fodiniaquatilis]|uniref:Uncharacterized protein n=1 Tax=Alicyclobacillus fodiniaquatilis TaxID=1661150 RepID=A0ABW4JI08_9BACL
MFKLLLLANKATSAHSSVKQKTATLHGFLHFMTSYVGGSSPAVEYVSWLSGFMFMILSIITVFLAFQFQTNVSESKKITYLFREKVKQHCNTQDLLALISDYQYYKTPSIVFEGSLSLSRVLLVCLIVIWIASGIARTIKDSFTSETQVNIIAMVLDLSITILFVYLSTKLIKILNGIENGDSKSTNSVLDDILDIQKLKKHGFELHGIINNANICWTITINGDDPTAVIYFNSEIQFHSYSLVLGIKTDQYTVYAGLPVQKKESETVTKYISLNKTEQDLLNSLLALRHSMSSADIFLWVLVDAHWFIFETQHTGDDINDLPKNIQIRVNSNATKLKMIELPSLIQEKVSSGKEFVIIDALSYQG